MSTAIIPYTELSLAGAASQVGDHTAVLSHTIVGPCAELELAVGSAIYLFDENRIARRDFTLSRTPYRAW
jgi:hypothetical protein